MRNYIRYQFTGAPQINDGFLFQNFVYQLLKISFQYKDSLLHFWRTKDGGEVDFIALQGLVPTPIEIKYSSLSKIELNQSMINFITTYKPLKMHLINLQLNSSFTKHNCTIQAIPYYFLI